MKFFYYFLQYKFQYSYQNIRPKISYRNFFRNNINFLGYKIKNGTLTSTGTNIEVIKKLKPPSNITEYLRFLGFINI